jgi:hypothetical protein
MLLDFFGNDPSQSLGARQVDPNTQQLIQGGASVNSIGPVCSNTVSINGSTPDFTQALGTLNSGSCLTVNGNIELDLVSPRFPSPGQPTIVGIDNYMVTVQQRQQEDLLITFTLTHPPDISQLGDGVNAPDVSTADFDMIIRAVDNQGRQSFLRTCTSATSPEICSVVLLSTDGIPSLQIGVSPFFGTGAYTLAVDVTQLNINRAACGNPLSENEPNNSAATAQNIGPVPPGGCLQFRGSISPATDVDFYYFTTCGNVLLIFTLVTGSVRKDYDFLIINPANNRTLQRCERAITPVEVCALTGLPSQSMPLRLQVLRFGNAPLDSYTLSIISAAVPATITPPPGDTPPTRTSVK